MNEQRPFQQGARLYGRLRHEARVVWQDRRRRRWLYLALAGLVIFAIIANNLLTPKPKRDRFGTGTVSVATIAKGNLAITLNALGTVTPLATVTVKPQVSGQITQIAFQEGQMVNAGDLLAVIDPRPFQAALDQAEGQALKDQAALQNAKLDLARYRTLLKQDSIAEQQVATQEALVRQAEATVKSDEALVETAKLNLSYTQLTAPVAGRVGLRQVDLGNYVETGLATGVVVVTQLQPISVVFAVPEDNLAAIGRRIKLGAPLHVALFDRANTTKLAESDAVTLDNQIDTTTGTLKLRAQFANQDGVLFPNQFVNVQLLTDEIHDTVLAPSAAVQYGAPGSFVYTVDADNTVALQKITVGPTDGKNVVVTAGLQPGAKVVTDGIDRLKPGMTVRVVSAQGGMKTPGAQTGPITDPAAAENPKGKHRQNGTRHRKSDADNAP
jgi:multidrug efflux system membrane fusion protein